MRPALGLELHTGHHLQSSQVCCALFVVPSTQLALHCGETTLQMPFSPQQAQTLDAALSKLLQTFAEKQAATRPKRCGSSTWFCVFL